MRTVEPLPGAAPYIGGKRKLAATIIRRISKVEHLCYAEPFIGMGGVFFRRTEAPKREVINDVSRDVATFFRVLQRHYQALVDMMRWQVTTRVEFERLCASPPATMTDLERSARFYYLQRTAYGGKVRGRGFGVFTSNAAPFDITRLVPQLEEFHARLAGVVIENLPYADFVARYDRPATLFYLDPPYFGCERDYGDQAPFNRDEFERLAFVLAAVKGRFILSLNDLPAVRRIFAGFTMEAVSTTYSVNGSKRPKKARELLISN